MKKIFNVMEKYDMIRPGMHVIAGVSGGADSVCLLYVLSEYRRQVPFSITAVHVEHGLRGKESLEDGEFTEKLCRQLDIPVRVVKAPVRQRAQEQGISLEEAGRQERYRIFEEIRAECGGHRIAVAHSQNDQAETVLWNLVRGSGLKGLGGIRPVRGNVIRPLLFTRRQEIEEILEKADISWRTDRTNLQQDYTRNRIRLSVLPEMERILNREASAHIAQAAEKLWEVQEYVDLMTDRAADSCLRQKDSSVIVDLEYFQVQDSLIQKEILRRAVELCIHSLKDFGSVHLEKLLKLTEMDCGKEISLPGRMRAVREKGILRLERAGTVHGEILSEDSVILSVPGDCCVGGFRISTEIVDNSPELMRKIIKEKKCTKWLSYDTINGNVLFRTRQTGDYLVVNRQGGKKKLKDYFIDLKIPRDCRDRIWLLAEGNHVLWIPGLRISEAAKVCDETKKVLKIQLEEENK